jgi:putative nucleotidyltransferase with HDIG domain
MRQLTKSSLRRLMLRAAEAFHAWRVERRTTMLVAGSFFLALAIVLLATQLTGFSLPIRPTDWEAGRVAEKDFVVDRDFPFVDEKATELKRAAREKIVPPVFRLNDEVTANAIRRFGSFDNAILRLARDRTSEEKAFLRLQVDFPGLLSASDVHTLMAYPNLERALDDARRLLQDALDAGIVDLSGHREEIANADGIELWKDRGAGIQTEEIPLEGLGTVENLSKMMQADVNATVRSDSERRLVLLLLRAFAVENAFSDAQNTAAHRASAGQSVEPVTEKLVKGQVLARRGDVISDSTAAKIRALGEYSNTVNLNGVIGSAFFLVLVFCVSLFLFVPRTGAGSLRRSQISLMCSLGLAYLLLAALSVRFFALPDWVPASVMVPASAFSMLVTILVSNPVGISFSLIASLALMLLTGMNIHAFLFALLSGIAGVAVVMNAERRIDLIRAGLILALIDCAIIGVLGLLSNFDPGRFLQAGGWAAFNGLACGVLSLGFLPVFEHLLNAPTRFRLMELSDLNSPIFKRMLSLAPGTYTHSISVANMAESACEAIGANALLARVSAYYHDIGKIDQADYFIENQKTFNKHDDMRASLSAAVIKSHVRIGVEKARELALPQAIVDIIAQHHGRGLITYFYHRAVNEEKNPRVSRDDYSYHGVRPKTKEAAVLMIADTVEAASRTLKRPTEARLERFVWDIVMDKFHSGELADSNLTLKDLETVKRSFVRILQGYFHARIEYPKLRRGKGEPGPLGSADQARESLS